MPPNGRKLARLAVMLQLEYWVMRRVAALRGASVPAHYIGPINRDELLVVHGFVLEPLESFATEELARSRAVALHSDSGVVHHVVLNADY